MTRVAVVTTTIGVPEVLPRYLDSARDCALEVRFYVVGDKKTPDLSGFVSKLGPGARWIPAANQDRWKTSSVLRWNCIQRRNIGFLEAAKDGGFDYLFSMDDDNEPQDGFFKAFQKVLKTGARHRVAASKGWFNYFEGCRVDPPVTPFPRGFPIRRRPDAGWTAVPAEIPADRLWVLQGLSTGDPDIDAYTHLVMRPRVKSFAHDSLASDGAWCPINSQNTFLKADLLPFFLMFDQVGRFDDIIAGYILQNWVYANGGYVHFGAPFTNQERGIRDWMRDFELEVEGHLTIEKLLAYIRGVKVRGLPPGEALRKTFAEAPADLPFFARHRPLVEAWLADLGR